MAANIDNIIEQEKGKWMGMGLKIIPDNDILFKKFDQVKKYDNNESLEVFCI